MATFNSAGNGDFNADATWTESGQPSTSDHAIIGAGHNVTMTADDEVGSIKISGTITGGGNTLTVNRASSNKPFDNDGTISGDLNVTITNTGAQQDGLLLDAMGTSGNINDLTLNLANGTTANKTIGIADATTIDGDLTITSGTFDTVFSGGSSQTLTVNGDVDVDGTLTANASTLTFGGHSRIDGTFARGTSTVIMDGNQGSVTNPTIRGFSSGNKLYNLICRDTATGDGVQMATDITVENDLTIENTASMTGYIADRVLTVEGDVVIAGIFRGNRYGTGAANSFGSLTINAGNGSTTGVFQATSGTTTITSEGAGGGTYALYNAGTFTHNSGTLAIEINNTTRLFMDGDNLYNLITGKTSGADSNLTYFGGSATTTTVLNNLTVLSGQFTGYNANNLLTVHGLTNVSGTLGHISNSATYTFNSLATIESSGRIYTSTGTNNYNGGVRNLGTFTSDDTVTIGGTGGILEGNLDDANVNVNLDATLDFDGSDDFVTGDDAGLPSGSAARSISMWIKPDAITQAYGCPFSYGTKSSSNGFAITWNNTTANFLIGKYGANSSGGSNSGANNSTIPMNAWSHFVVTVDGSGNIVYYLNGVADGTASLSGINTTLDVYRIGDVLVDWGTQNFDGTIADLKVFSDVLTAAEAQELSQKINYDISIGSIDNMSLWLKLNEGTGNPADHENNGTDYDGTNNGATWTFDEFSVDVQDNSTTTDGTFTVTQGKVEGKALTSLNFDGSNDHIVIGDNNDLSFGDGSNDSAFSISAWIRADASDGFHILTKGTAAAREYSFRTSGSQYLALNIYDETSGNKEGQIGTVALATDKFVHVVGTYDGTGGSSASGGITLYVDGTLTPSGADDSGSYTAMHNQTGGAAIGRGVGVDGTGYADGEIRDVKLFDYELSADQVASLYSGSYNVAPKHHWKLDDSIQGTATTTATDTGWKGEFGSNQYNRLDGTLTHFGATNGSVSDTSNWNNGTLDLDGTLTIAANGTLSAPRGNLKVSSTFENSGTYTHNNGTFFADAGGNRTYLASGSAGVTFYDFKNGANVDIIFRKACTFENLLECTQASANVYFDSSDAALTFTFGTTTSAGAITMTTPDAEEKGVKFSGNTTNAVTMTGASSLYPVVCTGKQWHFDKGGSGSKVKLANIDYDPDITTGGAGVTITLTGDCEFDTVTISSGDELDLNGQRFEYLAVASGGQRITNSSGNALLVGQSGGGFNSSPHQTNLDDCDHIVGGTSTTDLGNHRTTMFNLGSGTNTVYNWGKDGYYSDIIIGSGTLRFRNSHATYLENDCKNLTIATGGILDWGTNAHADSKITCSGDFTTSGGLIGKSALNLTGSEEVTGSDNLDEVATTNKFTIEAWFKASSDANYRAIFSRGTSWGTGNLYVYMNSDGNVQASSHDLGNTLTSTTNGLADSKWHHIAYTYDTTTIKLYIDGKLEASAASTTGINTQSNGFKIGDRSGANWVGNIGRVSVWKNALTEGQIRNMLFMDWTTMAADNYDGSSNPNGFTDSDAIGWWQFDEGTNTDVEDLSSQSNDGTLNSAAWAGAGTFTYGTSTLVMSGSSKKIITSNGDTFNKLTISGTTSLECIVDGDSAYNVQDDLVISGTLSSVADEYIYLNSTFGSNSGTLTLGGTLTGLSQIINDSGVNLSIPAHTTKTWKTYDGATSTQAGDVTTTTELEIASGGTWNANGNTIAAREIDVNSGTLDLSNSTASLPYASAALRFDDSSTLLSGNSTVVGLSSAQKAYLRCPAAMGAELVGTLKWMNAEGGGTSTSTDITVIGHVIDCSLVDSTSNIRQWHHTLDTQQLLDADEAGDDDLRLTKPALDNALELMTK